MAYRVMRFHGASSCRDVDRFARCLKIPLYFNYVRKKPSGDKKSYIRTKIVMFETKVIFIVSVSAEETWRILIMSMFILLAG